MNFPYIKICTFCIYIITYEYYIPKITILIKISKLMVNHSTL